MGNSNHANYSSRRYTRHKNGDITVKDVKVFKINQVKESTKSTDNYRYKFAVEVEKIELYNPFEMKGRMVLETCMYDPSEERKIPDRFLKQLQRAMIRLQDNKSCAVYSIRCDPDLRIIKELKCDK